MGRPRRKANSAGLIKQKLAVQTILAARRTKTEIDHGYQIINTCYVVQIETIAKACCIIMLYEQFTYYLSDIIPYGNHINGSCALTLNRSIVESNIFCHLCMLVAIRQCGLD